MTKYPHFVILKYNKFLDRVKTNPEQDSLDRLQQDFDPAGRIRLQAFFVFFREFRGSMWTHGF
jgi:hypothetical protein